MSRTMPRQPVKGRGGSGRQPGIAIWIGRIAAITMAFLALAVILPDIPQHGWHSTLPLALATQLWDVVIALGYVAVASGLVSCICVGQVRSRTLELVGWLFLCALFGLAFR